MPIRLVLTACALALTMPVVTKADSSVVLPMCAKADLNVHFQFFRDADSLALSVLGHNISSHACAFDGSLFYPSVQGRISTPPSTNGTTHPFPECLECGLVNGRLPVNPRPTLEPGEVARETFRWRTNPTPGPAHCLSDGWFASPSYLLVSPSLLQHICSDIYPTQLDVLTHPNSDLSGDELHLTAPKTTFDDGEHVPMRVTGSVSADQAVCPILFVWHRGPDGSTRVDEVPPRPSSACSADDGHNIDAGAGSRWSGPGEHHLQVLAVESPFKDGAVHLVGSNVLSIRVVDPLSIARTWFRVKGLGASIALDKDTYAVGEDIPLHMAIANFDAAQPIYSWDPLWDPCMAVSVQILQANGNVLPRNEAFESFPWCGGHGFGPRPFAVDRIVPIERDLRGQGWLPKNPGTYIVVLRWVVCTGTVDQTQTGWTSHLNVYANVEARAVIHIVPPV